MTLDAEILYHASTERDTALYEKNGKNNAAAVLLCVLLLLLSAASLLFILIPQKESGYIANIYQNGRLIESIPLESVEDPYRFTVSGENGCTNEIEVRPGEIGIVSADCPDKLCVHQGFVSDFRLPITCLPNRLVIQLSPAPSDQTSGTVDGVTY